MRGVVLAILLVGLAGCASGYRAAIDPDVLVATNLAWSLEERPVTGGGLFGGTKVAENLYLHSANGGTPYSGLIQVFTLSGDTRSIEELLSVSREAVANASAERHIELQGDESTGARTLQDGMATHFVAFEGRVGIGGGFPFPQDARVRILAEAGIADGGARIVAIAMAQIGKVSDCLFGECPTNTDMRTWQFIVGDPEGSVGGQRSDFGLIDHLVTHD